MTPTERQELENVKRELAELKQLFLKGDFIDKKIFYKELIATQGLTSERFGVKLVSPSNPIGVEIRTGSKANSADINAEIGSNLPNGSLYLTNQTPTPIWVMIGTTWYALNVP